MGFRIGLISTLLVATGSGGARAPGGPRSHVAQRSVPDPSYYRAQSKAAQAALEAGQRTNASELLWVRGKPAPAYALPFACTFTSFTLFTSVASLPASSVLCPQTPPLWKLRLTLAVLHPEPLTHIPKQELWSDPRFPLDPVAPLSAYLAARCVAACGITSRHVACNHHPPSMQSLPRLCAARQTRARLPISQVISWMSNLFAPLACASHGLGCGATWSFVRVKQLGPLRSGRLPGNLCRVRVHPARPAAATARKRQQQRRHRWRARARRGARRLRPSEASPVPGDRGRRGRSAGCFVAAGALCPRGASPRAGRGHEPCCGRGRGSKRGRDHGCGRGRGRC